MNLWIGTVKGTEIRKNRDSDSNTRMMIAEVSSEEDIQSVELILPQGEDFKPENNYKFLILEVTSSYKLGILIDDNIEPDEGLKEGEREIYSSLSGTKKAKLKFNQEGELILNDGSDFAVAFSVLKSEIDNLRNELIAHVHSGVATGSSNTGAPTVPFTIDISNAQVEKVRL